MIPDYDNMPFQYTAIFNHGKNGNFEMKNDDIFFIDCVYTFEPPLTSTHDLCLRAIIRKNVNLCKPQFYYIKVGCNGE